MPWLEGLSDPQKLRCCIRDLVALSTLPAIWREFDPQQIADSVAAALVSMLSADFVHITFASEHDHEAVIEVTHLGEGRAGVSLKAIRDALHDAVPRPASEQSLLISSPVGSGNMRIAVSPIGIEGDAMLVAGSHEPDFPTAAQRLLLGVGANDMAVALQHWRVEARARRFMSLIERSSDFVGLANMDGRAQYVNPAGLKLIGLNSVEAISRLNLLDFIVPEDHARARDAWQIVLRTGRWGGELMFCHFKTRAAVPFLVDWFRVDHPRTGEPLNLATVSRDLRAQKHAETELRQLNESLEQRVSERTTQLAQTNDRLVAEMSERQHADARLQEAQLELWHATRLSAAGHLAGALAHELNQPLTAIANSLHAVRRIMLDRTPDRIAKVPEILDEAAGQALRGGRIVQRLRDFVTRGETEKHVEPVRAVVEEACALALTGSKALGVDVQFHFDPQADDIFANRIQVQQVLVNLIHNALQAMAGTARREIVITTTLVNAGVIEISVADSGIGLAADNIDHLFEPFVSTWSKGMGLGLSIARSIVKAHGGKISAMPNPDGGAIFRFTLASSHGADDVE
jgi:PAS domain S-box-containing protein